MTVNVSMVHGSGPLVPLGRRSGAGFSWVTLFWSHKRKSPAAGLPPGGFLTGERNTAQNASTENRA